MFVKFNVGDKVAVLRSGDKKEIGTVVSVKKAECVVQIEGNDTPQSVHKTKLVKLSGKPEEDEYNPVADLAEFHKSFKYQRYEKPTALSAEEVFKRIVFIQEELIELLAASVETPEEFGNYMDKLQVKEQEAFDKELPKTDNVGKSELDKLIDQSDALVDILYFSYGTSDMSNIDLRPLFKIVQRANMNKLDPETGEPIYNEFGKIQKPEGWKEKYAPEKFIKEEILKQIKEADNNEQD